MLFSSCGFYCKCLNNGVCKENKKKIGKKNEEWSNWKKPGEKLRGHECLCLWKLLPLTVSVHTVAPVPKEKASHAANGGDVESSGWPGRRRQAMC